MKKKFLTGILLGLALLVSACASSDNNELNSQDLQNQELSTGEQKELNIAYQYGIAYAPLIIAEKQNLIEKEYQDRTGNVLTISWNQMNSGADINTGFASGDLNAGFVGVAPAISGISKKVGYKIFTNLSGQEHGFMTSVKGINGLEDLIGTDNQIALVNIGSIQHIILARALVEKGLEAHDLDANLVAMKHPDGMAALENGSISSHLTSSPYIFKERENQSLYEINDISPVWSKEDTFIVGVASEKLKEEDPELYNALCAGIEKAIAYINENPKEAAEITCEFNGNTVDEEQDYFETSNYSIKTKGVFDLAVFMQENGFIEEAPLDFYDLAFENVKGD